MAYLRYIRNGCCNDDAPNRHAAWLTLHGAALGENFSLLYNGCGHGLGR